MLTGWELQAFRPWSEPLPIPRQREIICSPDIQALHDVKRDVSPLVLRELSLPVHILQMSSSQGPRVSSKCHRKCNSVLRHGLRHRMSEDDSTVDEVLALKHEDPSSIPPEATGKEKDNFVRICWGGGYRWIPGTRWPACQTYFVTPSQSQIDKVDNI